jgi:hypothetical protein
MGIPVDTVFTVFRSLGGKFPFLAVPVFGNDKFLVVTTRVDTNFTNGDVYGKFVQSSTTGINDGEKDLTLKKFSLSQNFPNPYNPSTTIHYGLPVRSSVRLTIYNMLGQRVSELVNAEQDAGFQSVVWNASVASGLYFYRLEATTLNDPNKHFVDTKKMLLLR